MSTTGGRQTTRVDTVNLPRYERLTPLRLSPQGGETTRKRRVAYEDNLQADAKRRVIESWIALGGR